MERNEIGRNCVKWKYKSGENNNFAYHLYTHLWSVAVAHENYRFACFLCRLVRAAITPTKMMTLNVRFSEPLTSSLFAAITKQLAYARTSSTHTNGWNEILQPEPAQRNEALAFPWTKPRNHLRLFVRLKAEWCKLIDTMYICTFAHIPK